MINSNNILDKLSRFPILFLSSILLLCLIDIATLYSVGGGDFSMWASKQLISLLISSTIIIILGISDISHIYKYSYVMYLIGILLLIIADIIGYTAMGAQRWIKIGGMTIQPSEITKPFLIVALARYYNDININLIGNIKTHIIPLILITIPAALVLKQPNLGTALVITSIGVIIIMLAGMKIWKFAIAAILALSSMPIVWNSLHPYQKKRVLSFLNPDEDPLGASYNIIQSKIAIGSGSFTGAGFMSGSQSQLSFLPEKHTDFIFTVIAEEYGFIGSTIVLFLFASIAWQSLQFANHSRHQFVRLISGAFSFMIVIHTFINIGMITGMMPAVGIPLPFLSYGGSNLIASSITAGFVVNGIVHNKSTLRF
jgi:rod shape determining protein RodA